MLHSEAQLAGLLDHGTLIGMAREFFVSRVLRSVLPPTLHFGTGQIIAANGDYSSQVDVVVYDGRYPVMETQPGHGLYLIDGVVAAIEVKSEITGEKLRGALDNCHAVNRMFAPGKFPQTYVFGFKCGLSIDTCATHVREWWNVIEKTEQPTLPAIVVAGPHVGIASGSLFQIGATDPPRGVTRVLMGFWNAPHRFGWLLVHLLASAADRLDCKSEVDRYLPMKDYWLEELQGALSARVWEESGGQVLPDP
jgi:hypothetical protein